MYVLHLSRTRIFRVLSALIVCIGVLATQAKAQTFPPLWNATSVYTKGDIVIDPDGNNYRCIQNTGVNHLYPRSSYNKWELYDLVAGPLIEKIGPGQRFPSLVTALNFVKNARIKHSGDSNAFTLQLVIVPSASTYVETVATPISLNHAYGADIQISSADPARAILNLTGTNGFVVDRGHAFGLVSGITIKGVGAGCGVFANDKSTIGVSNVNIQNFYFGILADNNSNIELGSAIDITQFSFGIYSATHSSITCNAPLVLNGNTAIAGFDADQGGIIRANNCTATNFPTGLGGFYAEHGGSIIAQDSKATYCACGYRSSGNSSIVANRSTVDYCTWGWYAISRSYIEVPGGTYQHAQNYFDSTSTLIYP